MRAALFDSALYIAALRRGDATAPSSADVLTKAPLWLSAVVLEELYAGANLQSIATIKALERAFKEERKILVPNADDWAETGKVLARLAALYDYEEIGRGRLANDALIATSAGRLKILILTSNARDFRRLAEFCSFQWQHIDV